MNTPAKEASLVMLQALVTQYLDEGGANATLVFYDDAKPVSVNVAANNSAKLLTLAFPKPSLKAVTTDHIELFPTNTAMTVKTGTAIWARLFNAAGVAVVDVTIGTDIILDNANLVIGSNVKLDAVYLTPPI
ncbi:hypothetical protein MJ004_13080 [Acinetobacter junii]|uniref:hypothetical protein n=1 Tax=Acinetobacter junii TaxID=40215 RepID=UPI0022EB7BA7|nr:hypothetical protein [Acinetobacter junii]MDA3509325.1 hypothetical protein [Acinetobacter junii]MDA3533624.1 hypothetical protein [Acinetobacter junii]